MFRFRFEFKFKFGFHFWCGFGSEFGFMLLAIVLVVLCTRNKCQYFIYGKGDKLGWCFWEHTATACLKEGLEADSYDFYSITAG